MAIRAKKKGVICKWEVRHLFAVMQYLIVQRIMNRNLRILGLDVTNRSVIDAIFRLYLGLRY